MKVKNQLPPLEKIRKLLQDRQGMIFASDLARLNIPRAYLSLLEKNKEIERVARGVYKTPNSIEDEMRVFQAVYKSTVFSHETALYLHDLTDRSPLFYSVAAPVGYHSAALNRSGHKVFYVNRRLFSVGVAVVPSPQGNPIKATDLERTLCDAARSRNQMDVQVVLTAFKRYAARKDKNLNRLHEYAKLFRVQNLIRQYIEILL